MGDGIEMRRGEERDMGGSSLYFHICSDDEGFATTLTKLSYCLNH